MPNPLFVSYAQNGEDVVLYRALGTVEHGRYIDVGANDPTVDSVSRAFYDAGWRGITVEPVHEYADRQRSERPEDTMVEVVVTQTSDETVRLLEIPDTGLSTIDEAIGEQHRAAGFEIKSVEAKTRRLDDILDDAGWTGSDIHFMSVDVEGAEAAVLGSVDLRKWRPWIIVAEATRPQSSEPSYQAWEPILTAADYRFSLFDGLSRFYIASERWDQLHESLQAPANPLDRYIRYDSLQRDRRIAELNAVSRAGRAPWPPDWNPKARPIARELAKVSTSMQTIEAELARTTQREQSALQTAVAWRSRALGTVGRQREQGR